MYKDFTIEFEGDEVKLICDLVIETRDNLNEAETCPSYVMTTYEKVKKVCDQVGFTKKDG